MRMPSFLLEVQYFTLATERIIFGCHLSLTKNAIRYGQPKGIKHIQCNML